jgi:hypothetical protein
MILPTPYQYPSMILRYYYLVSITITARLTVPPLQSNLSSHVLSKCLGTTDVAHDPNIHYYLLSTANIHTNTRTRTTNL